MSNPNKTQRKSGDDILRDRSRRLTHRVITDQCHLKEIGREVNAIKRIARKHAKRHRWISGLTTFALAKLGAPLSRAYKSGKRRRPARPEKFSGPHPGGPRKAHTPIICQASQPLTWYS